MGLRIKVDLETNQGPTDQLYVRIDSWKINMTVNEIKFTTTSWLDKTYGDKFLRKYYDEELKSSLGLVSSKVVYYPTADSQGVDLDIDNLYNVPMYVEKEVKQAIYKEQDVSKEVPYVSFNEEGDEVTLYRTVTTKEQVQVGEEVVVKQVVDYTIVDRLTDFCYEHLIKELSRFFPEDKIEKL
jgi:hypothetical protein